VRAGDGNGLHVDAELTVQRWGPLLKIRATEGCDSGERDSPFTSANPPAA